jgi:hypothetical protein
MPNKWRLGSTLPVLAALAVIPASAQTSSSAPEALLMKYCFTCHSEKLHTAGLALDKMDFSGGRGVGKGRCQAADWLDASAWVAAAG